ncbi:Metal-dependent hydrolase, endonuclease/exonuclease/phosphatase family [Dyadobacter soli]|uniref:Metal-dependent hydrolase, endonuclease/exonuclease/phosphatase family n=1 Tax=Dyadobacter soli TaxID=659014 RepID=A0A1G6YE85_9BACT|nr:endonuclease/exonuclease/phosphatase family protein [Dyadobacter soli]SDD88591.1 Metal-dependent hydrolase, endonuclease/exonuclease/phosphatase family [Dyadobacter soli]
MKGIKRLLWFLYQCFACYTLLIYTLILWVPSDGWVAGFMMMSFPAVVFVHLISIPIWFVVERKKAVLPLILFVAAGLFLSRTYGFNGSEKTPADSNARKFSVMSYNVHVFQKYGAWRGEGRQAEIREMKAWIGDSGADVLCLPEYYDEDDTVFDSGNYLRKRGYRDAAYYHRRKYGKSYWGLAILSKHPIIASRDTVFEAQNGMIQADIKIGRDTVRVIGLHLYSMTLGLSKLVRQKEMDGIEAESRITVRKMKNGFQQRAGEFRVLQEWIKNSPYPVLVCGDFNEVPYSYIYGQLRKSLKSSFEEKGQGFGFSFNHLPYFIRIDHQFYDGTRLSAEDFTTFSNIKYSDHYPIMGTYTFK